MHADFDQPAIGVYQGMALAVLRLLSCFVAAGTACLAGLGALTIQDRHSGARLTPDPLARLHDEVVVDALPCAAVAEPDKPATGGQKKGVGKPSGSM